jgi:hypothetical protein
VHRARASLDDPVPHASRARRRRRANARRARGTVERRATPRRSRRVVVDARARRSSTRGAVTAASNDVARSLLRARFPRARRRGGEAPKIEVGEATHRDASRRIATRGGR